MYDANFKTDINSNGSIYFLNVKKLFLNTERLSYASIVAKTPGKY